MRKDKILDRHISFNNYDRFKGCSITDSGNIIRFTMANSVSYGVPVDYLVQWYSEPHYMYYEGKWIKWNSSKYKRINSTTVTFRKCRRILTNTAVRVYLSNNTAYDVPWDTVLMACEERYEHFGGLTDESRKMTREFYKKNKTF